MLSLIISDVIGDPVELIASGPTVLQQCNVHSLQSVLGKYKRTIEKTFPESVKSQLMNTNTQKSAETITYDERISHFVIGNNTVALEAAASTAKEHGYTPIIVSSSVEGDVVEVSQSFAILASATWEILHNRKPTAPINVPFVPSLDHLVSQLSELSNQSVPIGQRKVCLLSGGEPTVLVRGEGVGGRNQELCLHFTKHFSEQLTAVEDGKVSFMSLGTDGQDGPTDAAGAMVDGNTWKYMVDGEMNPDWSLERNDSNTLLKCFNSGKHLIKTGLTGTNVMDIQALLFDC